MEYRLKIQEETIPVEINSNEGNTATATIENREYDLKYTLISENELHLMVNGKSVNVYLAKNKNGKTILLNGRTYQVQDMDNLPKGPKKKKGIDGPTKVTPPMPAVVIAVGVNEGDRVEKGQKVVVVSAMKMETTLVAPYNGIVTRVNVQEGDKVMPGDILVDIDEIKDDKALELEN
jgi:biotin carboxyl carrier protein